MKFLSFLLSVVSLTASAATDVIGPTAEVKFDPTDDSQLLAAMKYAGIPHSRHRELQLEFLGILCGLFSAVLPGEADCQCNIGFGISVACAFGSPFCFGDFCTQPVVTAGFNYLTLEITFDVCTNQSTNKGDPLPGACFDFGLRAIEPGGPGVTRRRLGRNKDDKKSVGLATKLEHCTISIMGEACNFCRPCQDGWGYEFDCSNVDDRMVQSQCTELHVIGSFVKGQSQMKFLPVLNDKDER